jgi:hypothetical protein
MKLWILCITIVFTGCHYADDPQTESQGMADEPADEIATIEILSESCTITHTETWTCLLGPEKCQEEYGGDDYLEHLAQVSLTVEITALADDHEMAVWGRSGTAWTEDRATCSSWPTPTRSTQPMSGHQKMNPGC